MARARSKLDPSNAAARRPAAIRGERKGEAKGLRRAELNRSRCRETMGRAPGRDAAAPPDTPSAAETARKRGADCAETNRPPAANVMGERPILGRREMRRTFRSAAGGDDHAAGGASENAAEATRLKTSPERRKPKRRRSGARPERKTATARRRAFDALALKPTRLRRLRAASLALIALEMGAWSGKSRGANRR